MLADPSSPYGLLLGAYGVGAVLGATGLDLVRRRLRPEQAARLLSILLGAMIILAGISSYTLLTCAALLVAGFAWMILVAQFNVAVQMSAPRWVTARALACYGSALTGGLALGAWLWGSVATALGTGEAMMMSGAAMVFSTILGLVFPLARSLPDGLEQSILSHQPQVGLALTSRSGPIVVEIDYRVDTDKARDFYAAMQKVRSARLRSGAFGWSVARDIADPELWTEHYHCPTWGDYLHQRDRMTMGDRQIEDAANIFHMGRSEGRVRRRLERPTGSVRWRADTPDRRDEAIDIIYP